jgi:hypothetical protein
MTLVPRWAEWYVDAAADFGFSTIGSRGSSAGGHARMKFDSSGNWRGPYSAHERILPIVVPAGDELKQRGTMIRRSTPTGPLRLSKRERHAHLYKV